MASDRDMAYAVAVFRLDRLFRGGELLDELRDLVREMNSEERADLRRRIEEVLGDG